ncbi:hypothetical protein, partial [Streptomyces sp. NRRL S-15]
PLGRKGSAFLIHPLLEPGDSVVREAVMAAGADDRAYQNAVELHSIYHASSDVVFKSWTSQEFQEFQEFYRSNDGPSIDDILADPGFGRGPQPVVDGFTQVAGGVQGLVGTGDYTALQYTAPSYT